MLLGLVGLTAMASSASLPTRWLTSTFWGALGFATAAFTVQLLRAARTPREPPDIFYAAGTPPRAVPGKMVARETPEHAGSWLDAPTYLVVTPERIAMRQWQGSAESPDLHALDRRAEEALA